MTTDKKQTAMNIRVSPDTKQVLDDLVAKAGIKQTALLEQVAKLYQVGGLSALGFGVEIDKSGLNPEQTDLLNQAVAITGGSVQDFMFTAALSKAEQVVKMSSMDNESLKNMPNSANMRIHAAVNEIIENNKTATDWFNKVELTQGVVFGQTGSNRSAIRKYFEDNTAMIEEHNAVMKFEKNHNTKAAVHWVMQRKTTPDIVCPKWFVGNK